MDKYDLSGKQFGFWTVLHKDEPHPGKRNSFWVCQCKCGEIRTINRSTLVNGQSKSCGCWDSPNKKGINQIHGMSRTRLYHEWVSMRNRCKNPNDKSASSYYLKGISVCKEWNSDFSAFRDWALSNGYSDSLTIDRIDNSKGYSPDNCRWVSMAEQQQNRTNNVYVEYNGKQWCLRTLCTEIGFPYKLAHRRYKRAKTSGKTISAEILFTPIHTEKIAHKYRKPILEDASADTKHTQGSHYENPTNRK